jgi:ankyrin repeat protein
LHWACTTGHIDVVNILVGHGADLVAADQKGTVPLHEAAFHGKTGHSLTIILEPLTRFVDILMYLISRGAEVEARDLTGVSPLHWAAVNGHLGCCRLLLANGANVNAMTNESDVRKHCLE